MKLRERTWEKPEGTHFLSSHKMEVISVLEVKVERPHDTSGLSSESKLALKFSVCACLIASVVSDSLQPYGL